MERTYSTFFVTWSLLLAQYSFLHAYGRSDLTTISCGMVERISSVSGQSICDYPADGIEQMSYYFQDVTRCLADCISDQACSFFEYHPNTTACSLSTFKEPIDNSVRYGYDLICLLYFVCLSIWRQ